MKLVFVILGISKVQGELLPKLIPSINHIAPPILTWVLTNFLMEDLVMQYQYKSRICIYVSIFSHDIQENIKDRF
jgi:hypothetical protein